MEDIATKYSLRGNTKPPPSYNPGTLVVAVSTAIMECAMELMVFEKTELPRRLRKGATTFT